MGRKRTLNRMDFQTDEETPEKAEDEEADDDDEEAGDDDEEEGEADAEAEAEVDPDEEPADEEEAPKPKKKKKAAAPKKPAKRRAAKVIRMKAVWVVFDNSSKQIETFPYNAKAEAEALIETKNTDKKGACYLQLLKVALEE